MSDTFNSILQIPLISGPQSFFVSLSGVEYEMTLTYHDAIGSGWTLDMATAGGSPVLSGIPLVCGLNLLEPYSDLALPPGGLFVMSQPQVDADLTFDSLGVSSFLYYAQ